MIYFIAILFALIAAALKYFKWYWLIAGYIKALISIFA